MSSLQFLESIKKMPLMELPVRSSFIQIENSGVLISPGSQLKPEQLRSLNKVTDIIAPNLLHTAGVPGASEIFLEAKIWGPRNCRKEKPEIEWDEELSESAWPYQNQLVLLPLEGQPQFNENLFLHKQSESLILTDSCFNMTNPNGAGAWIILHLFGTYKKLAVSSLFKKFIKDKNAFEKSLGKVFSHDFKNVVVGHGENVPNGREQLLNAFINAGLKPR